MNIWVVIPGYNEAPYVQSVLKKALSVTQNIIFVDDGSKDDTYSKAKKCIHHVLRHEINLGKGSAMKTGATYAFEELNADAVVFMDADDQHDPKELPRFFQALSDKVPVVLGVRTLNHLMPLSKIAGNRLASFITLILFGAYIPDIPSGYKGIHKSVWKKVFWKSSGYEVEAELAMLVAKHRIQFRVVPIDVIYHDHEKGMTVLDALHIARCLLQWKIGI